MTQMNHHHHSISAGFCFSLWFYHVLPLPPFPFGGLSFLGVPICPQCLQNPFPQHIFFFASPELNWTCSKMVVIEVPRPWLQSTGVSILSGPAIVALIILVLPLLPFCNNIIDYVGVLVSS